MNTIKLPTITYRHDLDGPLVGRVPESVITAQEPTILDEARHLGTALRNLNRRGVKITPRAGRKARSAACGACEFWVDRARFGLGRCRHKDCGCTRLKVWVAIEKCPLNKWPQVS